MSTSQSGPVGLFVVTYEVSTGMPGAPNLLLNLVVSTPDRSIAGKGVVTQPVNPPIDMVSSITGDFSYLILPPDQSQILVLLVGRPLMPSGPLPQPDLFARLLLDSTWQSGVGSFSFEHDGTWTHVDNAEVKAAVVPTL